tara:strand:+ start:116 stop:247 length:132 start_codon:yes stop_codon:yes gene_type:complete
MQGEVRALRAAVVVVDTPVAVAVERLVLAKMQQLQLRVMEVKA